LISADRANALWCVALDHKTERDARPIHLVREATLAHAGEDLVDQNMNCGLAENFIKAKEPTS
jgi:hypothetical protein